MLPKALQLIALAAVTSATPTTSAGSDGPDVAAGSKDYTQYVNIFRGTTNGGNMFPGVVGVPFAVVKLGPDLRQNPNTDAYSGYLPSGNITGFSMMHESGTGGAPKYGVVSQMPVSGSLDFTSAELSEPRAVGDNATVGYYKSQLASGVTVELAATEHAGYFQYTFPNNGVKSVIVDVSHFLPSFRGLGWSQQYLGGEIEIFEDGHYEGSGSYEGGWNRAPEWTIYFCGYFEQPYTTAYTFEGNNTLLSNQYRSSNQSSNEDTVGGVFQFNKAQVQSRVGVSWISSKKACNYVNSEIPSGTKLKNIVQNSKNAWNSQVLSKITTNDKVSSNLANIQQLYSNLYGMFLIPSNRTSENPLWPSNATNVIYYDDIFTYWDLHRCSLALTHIVTPQSHREQMQSLVNIYTYEGWMPDARSSNWNGETQGGSNADNVLADAYVKGVTGVDWETAYEAMYKDAFVTPPDNRDPRAPDSSTTQGRGALPDWIKYGYITPNFSRAVSRGIEYAANDFAVYQVAKGLGKPEAALLLNRSSNWVNYYNTKQTSFNFTGFLVPRMANGSFQYPYDPTQCGGCYWGDPYYEALPWEYLFSSRNHDMARFINMSGGPETFVKKLQTVFKPGAYSGNGQFGNTLVNPGNEPSFNSPYYFNFAGRQDLTANYSRYINTEFYNAGTGGIPGNSDAGAMQSYQLWNMIGLYPMVSTTTFLIASPWFNEMTIDLEGGKTLKITSKGGSVANNVFFVQSLKVNGEQWTKSWVSWDDVFANGGTMEYVLGPNPVNWATGELPPSPAS